MPSLRPCLKCGKLVRGASRCEAHTYRWGKTTGTLSWDWTQIRNKKLEQNPYCEKCGLRAVTVDHIVARAFGGTHEPSNLMSLCRACAKAKDHADSQEGKRRKGLS